VVLFNDTVANNIAYGRRGEVSEADIVRAAEQALHRLEHNPDSVLGDVEFDTIAEREAAERLAEEKGALVAAMARPDTDRKATGQRIREVNAALQELLAPLGEELRRELERRRSARDASAVLTDRSYPFCLWDPREVMDKVRWL
jgi:DNA-binding LytR/AlgR family response regulator